jgi:16S rRNA pseudouridine516 synthase
LSDGTRFKPALAEAADSTRMNVYVSVTEGKYHQVRRMLKSVGSPVADLKRLSIGGLVLDPALSPGEYRELDEQEISRIFEK